MSSSNKALGIAEAFCSDALTELLARGWCPDCDEIPGEELEDALWDVVDRLKGPLPAGARGLLRAKPRPIVVEEFLIKYEDLDTKSPDP